MASTRINYKTIIDKYRAQGKGNVRLTRSTLYLSKAINAASTSYSFDVLETQNATLQSNEIRLNLNDEFIITELGIYVEAALVDVTNTTTYGSRLLTYAPWELKSTLAGINAVWNGALQISVNNVVYLDKFDTAKCQRIPTTLYGNFVAATAAITAVNSTQASHNYEEDGMVNIEPMLTLSGSKKNNIILTLPSAITAPAAVTIKTASGDVSIQPTRVVLVARGLNAQNGATFQN